MAIYKLIPALKDYIWGGTNLKKYRKTDLDIISEYANSYIENHIFDFLYKTSTEYNSDIIGLGKYLLPNYLTLNDWYNVDWPSNYKNSFFDVSADVNIVASNLILKN